MIDISNLRIEKSNNGWTKLIADISSDFKRVDNEKTIWIAVKDENADLLTPDVYNMFLFLPLYMSMHYHQDLHLHGPVSKTLYRNVCDYLQEIMISFSDELTKQKVIVDGYKEAEGEHKIIGTGLSCGIDNLVTIYKYYQNEKDEDYKINGLFMLNCGWHGFYGDPQTIILFTDRCQQNKKMADELNLKMYEVDSNLHAFLSSRELDLGDKVSYFMIYSCIFGLEKGIGKYYISSSFSYEEILNFNQQSHDSDFSEFADSYALPLMHSKNLSLVSDGCQYSRSRKTEIISDWDITKKYLNVCCANTGVENCSVCHKCMRTLLPLEAMGKLDSYSVVFDIEKYQKTAFKTKCNVVIKNGRDAFLTDNYNFCKDKGLKLPSKWFVEIYTFFPRLIRKMKYVIGKISK